MSRTNVLVNADAHTSCSLLTPYVIITLHLLHASLPFSLFSSPLLALLLFSPLPALLSLTFHPSSPLPFVPSQTWSESDPDAARPNDSHRFLG